MARLYIEPQKVRWGDEHSVGDSFSVDVYIGDVEDCYGVQFEVRWNPDVLELIEEPAKGDFLEAEGISTLWMKSCGADYALCCYMRFQAPSGVDVEKGLVATLSFKAKSKGMSDIAFVPDSCTWVDSSYGSFSFDELIGASFQFGVFYPIIKIEDLRYPSEANYGDVITVEVDWANKGGNGVAWTKIIDVETEENVVEPSQWQVVEGDIGTLTYRFNMPNKDLILRIEVGHIE